MAKILVFARLALESEYFITEELGDAENLKAEEIKLSLSGKVLNTSRIMKKHHDIEMYACIGNDHNSKLALDYLTKYGFKTDKIFKSNHSPTGQIALINQPSGKHISIHHYGANEDLMEYVKLDDPNIFEGVDLIYTDTAIPPVFLTKIMYEANKRGVKVALDAPKRKDELVLKDISTAEYFMPNREEASYYSSLPTQSNEDIEYALKKLKEIFKGTVLITLDKEGCAYLEKDSSEVKFIPPNYTPEKVIDTTGAGDIFRGTFISEILLNNSIEDSIKKALQLSSKSTEIKGVNESIERILDIYA